VISYLHMKLTNQPKIYRGGRYTLSRAFTLIELLVVIAIIGILATVVIASLNSARTKGRHAAIKSNLRNAVSQANIYFNENGTYTGLCSDPKIQEIVVALGGSGNAACFTPNMHANTAAIVDVDFGIAATYNGIHFTADPSGVLQLDVTNTGGLQSRGAGIASCATLGKRLPGLSSFRALYSIANSTPVSFSSAGHWTSTEVPYVTTDEWAVYMQDGNIGREAGSLTKVIRCGS
jgi:prepilin-type N-terminal cleavage/methylation domain-containing protein